VIYSLEAFESISQIFPYIKLNPFDIDRRFTKIEDNDFMACLEQFLYKVATNIA
jgi:hypothetical protein